MEVKRTDPFGQDPRAERESLSARSASPTIPEQLDLVTTAEGVVIRRVWRSWKIAFYAIFAVGWDTFLVVWYRHALANPKPDMMMLLFPLLHVAAGVGITYYVIASFFNKTDITVTTMGVRIETGPVPWIGNKELNADEISAVLVRERSTTQGRKGYQVMYADRDRREKKLLPSPMERDQAEFIANTIQQTLRLPAMA